MQGVSECVGFGLQGGGRRSGRFRSLLTIKIISDLSPSSIFLIVVIYHSTTTTTTMPPPTLDALFFIVFLLMAPCLGSPWNQLQQATTLMSKRHPAVPPHPHFPRPLNNYQYHWQGWYGKHHYQSLLLAQCSIAPAAQSMYPYPAGTRMVLICPEDYVLVGNSIADCKDDGQWSVSAFGYCRFNKKIEKVVPVPAVEQNDKKCLSPKTPIDAVITAQSKSILSTTDKETAYFPVNGWIRYLCGTVSKGEFTIMCRSDGTWSAELPWSCKEVTNQRSEEKLQIVDNEEIIGSGSFVIGQDGDENENFLLVPTNLFTEGDENISVEM